ncbi:MAG TPA: hypothetical protein V6D14_03615 [Coleofasciculaceae cyanobacterium]
MPKQRELRRFHVQAPLRDRERRGFKLVFRLGRKKKASALETREQQGTRTLPPSPPPSQPDPTRSTSSALVPIPKRHRRSGVWHWSLLWLSVFSLVGVTLAVGALFLTKLPPPVHCQSISPLSSDSDRLYCAQLAAESRNLDQLEAAIKLVQDWSPNHALYPEAQRLLKKWSEVLLQLAQQKVKQGDRSGAVTIASKIPISSPIYALSQAKMTTWKQELKQGQEITSKFKEALKAQNWQQAYQLITQLSQMNQEYGSSSHVDSLIKQLAVEKDAWQQLEEARNLAKTNQLAKLEEAIALAGKINPNSYARAEALREQSLWSRTLLQIAAGLFKNQDFDTVITVAQKIPVNTIHYAEAQDWIQLGRAAQSAKKDNILALLDAVAAVHQLNPKSPLQSLATKQATLWQSQLQDHAKLQVAGAIASFQQRTGLQMAIEQANRVAPGHSQRLRAQTLIAQWRKEIQQIEDRNKLGYAQQLAVPGTLEQLKAAVEIASQIQLGQPLRLDAQTAIAKWNRQIQTIEDQPILELAQTFGQRQDWIAAIATAGQIRVGRALYSEAQQAIALWQTQVQIAQDRPILEAATALAAQGRFDAAIATVSQISSDRALYGEAQTLKSLWTSQKPAIDNSVPSVILDHN